ncbi:MAG: PAS domain S-box protein [Chlorobiales bacterium]|nr:PAS domain S-box protein [Chlorobiales bacterium]
MTDTDNTYLIRAVDELQKRLDLLEETLREKERLLADRQCAEERAAHLKMVLRAIRNVNQLIVKETDPRNLIERAAETLTGTLGYYSAWIALLNENGKAVTTTAFMGFAAGFDPICTQLQRGEFPDCMRKALECDETIIIQNPATNCPNCPLSPEYAGRTALTKRLAFGNRPYGILTVSVPATYANDTEEQSLFNEVAEDLGFALHKIETAKALRESKELYHILFECTHNPILVANQDGVYIDANDAALLFLETARDEFLGKTVWDYTPADLLEEQKKEHAPFLEPRTLETVYEVKGNRKTLLLNVVPVNRGKQTILFGIGQDITERKRAEEMLRESELLYRSTLKASPDGIVITDIEGRINMVSPSATTMFGYRDEMELHGVLATEFLATEDRARAQSSVGFMCNGESKGAVEYHGLRADGTSFDIEANCDFIHDATGQITGRVFIIRDITERKRAEAERERLIAGIEQAGEIILITDPEGSIQYTNPAFERITGYSRNEVIGKNPRILKSGNHDNEYYASVWETIKEGRTWAGRFINKRKNGSLYTEEASIAPVRDASGAIVNYVAVQRDITRELETEQQLVQAQKMESVGRLAGGVAHDFNNMLVAIIGYADMCRHELPADHRVRKWIDEIINAGHRSANLTRQLLAFARQQTISPKVLDLNETVASMHKLLQRLIGEHIDLVWRPGANLWPVKIDPSQIDQILANLCVNARDAIVNTGRVTIETENVAIEGANCTCRVEVPRVYLENVTIEDTSCIHHAGAVPGAYVMLAVSDNGTGIEKDVIAHIFEPFFTTKGLGEGTGLGLATVYGIVKQNNGYINVYSEPGKGTTFKIYLPRFAGKAEKTTDTEMKYRLGGWGETVLLVEDEQSVRTACHLFLEDLGYKILEAEKPTTALDLVARYPDDIHLLLTDVIMPGMNGRQLAEQLRAVRPDIKVLFMSGYTASVIAQHGTLDEGDNFITKPFSRDDLGRKVREVLDK